MRQRALDFSFVVVVVIVFFSSSHVPNLGQTAKKNECKMAKRMGGEKVCRLKF